jgi:glycosyltransferase involved in cell wall biosynthesis
MKICYIAASAIPSRTANSVHVMKMCQAYARLGHEVSLVLPGIDHECEKNVEDVFDFYGIESRFRLLRVANFRPRKLWYTTALSIGAVLRTRADWYHTRVDWTGFGLVKFLRQPTLLEMHDVPKAGSLREKFFKLAVKSSNMRGVVSITSALQRMLAPHLPASMPTLVASDGVDSSLIENAPTRDEAQRVLGIDHHKQPLIVYTGHLYEGRGVELVIELAKRHPHYRFMLVGGRNIDIEHWRRDTSDLRNVEFVGFVPPSQVFTYLCSADVLLMPYAHKLSHSGGGDTAAVCSPMKMFEYMGAKRPIIASDLPVLQEVLASERNCLIAAYDSVEQWSTALTRLVNDLDCSKRIADQAGIDIQNYTWEARAKRLVDFMGENL